ncbi:mucin-1-like [Tyto alba]|uniref:mucin-1-like n=1 Tax=Tyto alba TaxID=56313 RepID=UPI001C67CE9E|nr:mucin-1-like [Tyto alba]
MPTGEEANARSRPAKGLPSLQERRQVRDGAGGRGRGWDGAAQSCLGARASLAGAVGAAVPRQPPPSHASSSSSSWSQVGLRQPQAVPQGSQSQALSLHGDRLPLLSCPESSQDTARHRAQMDVLAHRVTLPRNKVVQEETARCPSLPPVPRKAAAPGHAPTAAQPAGAVSTCPRLPPLPAAPSTSPVSSRETTSGTAASGRRQLIPSSWGIRHGQGTAASVESWRPAPHSSAGRAAAAKGIAQGLVTEVLDKVFLGSRGPSQQPAAQWNWAHSATEAAPPRAAEVWAASGGKAPSALPVPGPLAHGDTGAAGRAPAPASLARNARPGQLQQQQEGEERCFPQSAPGWLLSIRSRQMDSLAFRVTLPHSRVTRKQTDHLEILLPVSRKAAAPGHAPTAAHPDGAASTCPTLPPLPAAPSTSSASIRETTSGTTASGHQQLVPSSWGICHDQGTAWSVESWGLAPSRPAAHVTALMEAARCVVTEVLNKALYAIQGPSQQVAQRDHAQVMGEAAAARTAEDKGANSVKNPAAQPTPGPHGGGGTDASDRSLVPASPCRDVVPRCLGQASEHDLAMPVTRIKCYISSRLLPMQDRVFAVYLAIPSVRTDPLEELERSGPGCNENSLAQLRKPTLQVPEDKQGALAKKEDLGNEEMYQESSSITIRSICINPFILELVPLPTCPQEGPGRTSIMGPEAAGEAAGNLQDASPAPAGPMDPQPAASALARAPEEEEDNPNLSPMSGAQQGEASAALDSLAVHEDEVASSFPQNPPTDTATSHPADDRGDAAASPLPLEPETAPRK